MVLEMVFRSRYERLDKGDEKAVRVMSQGRRVWMKRSVKFGVKVSRGRKLNWKPFWAMLMLSRKVAKIYGGFVRRIMKMEEACPAITFSCSQWGLPVLSHSSHHIHLQTARKSSHMSTLTWL